MFPAILTTPLWLILSSSLPPGASPSSFQAIVVPTTAALFGLTESRSASDTEIRAAEVDAIFETLKKRDGRKSNEAKVIRALEQLGESALPELFAVYWDRALPSDVQDGKRALDQSTRLTLEERELLERVIVEIGKGKGYLRYLREENDATDVPEEKLDFIRFLGTASDHRGMDLFLEILGTLDPRRLTKPQVIREVERALARLADRDERIWESLDTPPEDLEEPALELLITAMSRVRTPSSHRILSDWMGDTKERDFFILFQLNDAYSVSLMSPDLERPLRQALRSSDSDTRRRATQVAVHFPTRPIISELIDLLEDTNRRISVAAHRSLKAISGVNLKGTRETWFGWYRDQERWLEEEWSRMEEELNRLPKSQALPFLLRLPEHRVHAEEFQSKLADCLRHHPDMRVRETAGRIIGRLGSMKNLEILIQTLDAKEASLAMAAHEALKRLTGFEHPREAKAWREILPRR